MAESVLVTGATGLVGSALVRQCAADGLAVFAAVRNVEKAQAMFRGCSHVSVIEWDVLRPLDVDRLKTFPGGRLDWLVHAAAETSTRKFVEKPVETIASILDGTRNVLELARTARVMSMVYLSSMEVYGAPAVESVTEADIGYLDPVRLRSNYPEAKRMAENLCVSYAKEYGVPVKIARLAQTFGEGVRAEDVRVYAQFARAILEGRDLVLKTDGSAARCYCYLGDAVDAVRLLLERGADATPYTVANEETFRARDGREAHRGPSGVGVKACIRHFRRSGLCLSALIAAQVRQLSSACAWMGTEGWSYGSVSPHDGRDAWLRPDGREE